jgi:hypothetical protein
LSSGEPEDGWCSWRFTYLRLEEPLPTLETACVWDESPGFKSDPQFWYRGFRIFAGQVDSADPTRFTMSFEADGKEGEIEGRLLPDGQVHLRMVKGYDWAKGASALIMSNERDGT